MEKCGGFAGGENRPLLITFLIYVVFVFVILSLSEDYCICYIFSRTLQMMDTLIAKDYKLVKKLGSGAFG